MILATDVSGLLLGVAAIIVAITGLVTAVGNRRVRRVEEKVEIVDTKVKTVDTKVKTVDSKIDSVDTKIDQVIVATSTDNGLTMGEMVQHGYSMEAQKVPVEARTDEQNEVVANLTDQEHATHADEKAAEQIVLDAAAKRAGH